jgi:16S rRNA (cytidine1402-2'-O)-methyltransferase
LRVEGSDEPAFADPSTPPAARVPDPQPSTTPGTLFIVATPIGNPEDITLRALRVLREVDLIAAEDTRVTATLLQHFGIPTPLTNYHQHSGGRKAESLLGQLRAGAKIALVSDAGMPGISDPGHELIRLAIAAGVPVVPVPGATALVAALAGGGLSTHRFAFEGFPPRDPAERAAFFQALRHEPRTLVFYESPRRLRATLRDLQAAFGGERQAVVARELTKEEEEFARGALGELVARFEARAPAGQCVLLVEGYAKSGKS